MRIGNRLVKLASAMALVVLAGSSGTFRTYYDDPVPAAQSANWRLSSVHVTAPRSLVVSEEEVYVPKADIVWREDPSGNRYEQVEALMERAIALASFTSRLPIRIFRSTPCSTVESTPVAPTMRRLRS